MKRFVFMLLILAVPLFGFASEASELFEQAKVVAKSDPVMARKLFQLSGLKFEALAKEHPALQADALYNAGNSYFFAEEQGRALYAWRRAEVLLPFNSELKENVAYLIELHGSTGVEAPSQTILHKFRAAFPRRVCVLLAMLFFVVLVASVAVWQWRGKSCRVLLCVSGGFACAFAVTVLVSVLMGPRNGVVLSFQSEARKGNGYIYEPAFGAPLAEASEFRVSKIRGDWVLATLSDGNQGWLPLSEVGLW